jgi:hypothetical protein
MRKFVVVLLAVGCLALLAGTLSMPVPGQVDLQAQKCDPKDPKCNEGTPCSPGYWKNHRSEFDLYCDAAGDCAALWAAVNCKGANDTCGRSDAAEALNAVSNCTE